MDKRQENKLSPLGKFIEEYKASDTLRLHMPGHKGRFGYEDDLTEIKGADSLYEAEGIIKAAEDDASAMFCSRRTFLGTEGSSQIIKAMCFLALSRFKALNPPDVRPVILASRNAHKAFIHASMLLGFDIRWMSGTDSSYSLCKCEIKPEELEEYIITLKKDEHNNNRKSALAAVFVTSPDYLGNTLDIKGLSKAAHRHDTLLLCDNAHGAYLKFLKEDLHPLSLGADMTSDSAHKTLPVMTGGAFLHISKKAPEGLERDGKKALLMFGSTSPSYPIMQSVAEALKIIDKKSYEDTADKLDALKQSLKDMGYTLYGNEPLKVVIDMRKSPMTGPGLSDAFRKQKIECEYSDPDFLVTMWSPYNRYPEDTDRFIKAAAECLSDYKGALKETPEKKAFSFKLPQVRYQPREIIYLPHRTCSLDDPVLLGSVAADALLSCPPAVSPIIAGEVFDATVVELLKRYGYKTAEVLI